MELELFITEEGFQELLQSKANLEKDLQKLREEKKEFSVSPSSNNEDYLAIEEEIQNILENISKKNDIINKVIIQPTPTKNEIVVFGKKVIIENLDTEEKNTYQIVGTFESDLSKNKISNICPMGKVLIGKTIEEEFYLNDYDYKIIGIE